MARRDLHGLVVETRCEAGEDPAELLLGLLPEAPAGAPAGLVVETVIAPGELDTPGDVVFTLGEVVMRAGEGGVSVAWPGALIRLPPHPDPLPRWGRGKEQLVRIALRAPLAGPAAWAFSQIPLLIALLAVLRPRGLHHLHAAALVTPDGRSLLVAGDAGAGKSTLATALVLAGCAYLGDDVVLVGRSGAARPSTSRPPEGGRYAQDERPSGGPVLLAFPRAFHLSDTSTPLVPGAAAADTLRRTLGGKRALDPRALFPGRERRDAPAPAALLFPVVTGEAETRLRAIPKAEALGRLVESSALVAVKALPGAREHLALLGAVADGARTFGAALGRDLLAEAGRTAARVLGEALP